MDKSFELLHCPVGDGAEPCVHACHSEVHRPLILHPKQVHHIFVALSEVKQIKFAWDQRPSTKLLSKN